MNAPTFTVGSGGSFSACHMFSALQQFRDTFSKPVTPLELHHSRGSIRDSNVVFLSASGRNSDILFAFDQAIKHDPQNILGLCMRKSTKLGVLAANYAISKIIELDCPAGKDGFLATNSLVAYFTILARLFGFTTEAESFTLSVTEEKNIESFVDKLDENFTLTVLFAGWGQPVAIDIESKFTEAVLGNVLFSDFRNFGHGRHNWFDKKKKQSAIVALVTPEEEDLANKTLGKTLIISYIGMEDMEVNITGKMDIQMRRKNYRLNDVVVIDYGTQKRRDLTGSVVTLSSRAYKDQPVVNASAALPGNGFFQRRIGILKQDNLSMGLAGFY